MSKVEAFRQHHFEDIEQQHQASWLGMWVFLATEVMFFGGMFACYFVYRHWYLQAFSAASNHLNLWLGAINTAVLICSSFTMALAVHSAETGRRKPLITYLFLTIVLGLIFLGIKSFEYHAKFVEHLVPGSLFKFEESLAAPAEIFFSLYFAMTGMHAVHMIIGIGLMTALILQARRGRFSMFYHTPVELTGLYWHFVDIVWIFLFPLLYLLGRHV
jgi:cytochrome c oxidase subunit III